MDLSKITDKAKGLIAKRGGTEALKEDAQELKDIATGEGSLTDKAKRATEALKDPGAAGDTGGAAGTPAEPPTPAEPSASEPSITSEPSAPGGGGSYEGSTGEPSGPEPVEPTSADPGPSGAANRGWASPGWARRASRKTPASANPPRRPNSPSRRGTIGRRAGRRRQSASCASQSGCRVAAGPSLRRGGAELSSRLLANVTQHMNMSCSCADRAATLAMRPLHFAPGGRAWHQSAQGPPFPAPPARIPACASTPGCCLRWCWRESAWGKGRIRLGTHPLDGWEVSSRDQRHAVPTQVVALASAPKRAQPVPRDVVVERDDRVAVARGGLFHPLLQPGLSPRSTNTCSHSLRTMLRCNAPGGTPTLIFPVKSRTL